MIQSQIFTSLGLDLNNALTQASLIELLVKNKQQQALQQAQDQINNNASQQNANRYKTELCRSFQENGICKYGEKCQFAHGYTEMRNMVRHPKYKTELCRTFHATGYCPYGPRCHFVHDTNESGKQSNKENVKSNNHHHHHHHSQQKSPMAIGQHLSNSSSQSVSPQQQVQSVNNFDFDLLNLKIQQETHKSINMSRNQTNSLLMLASESQSSGKSTRLNSVDSAFSVCENSVSPSSSRSLSPDAFLQQPSNNTNIDYFSTNDLFYSMLNQRSYAQSSSSTQSFSSSLSSSSSTHSSSAQQFSDLNASSSQDMLVNQILNQIYMNSSL